MAIELREAGVAMLDVPDVHYARSGGVAVACQVVGEAPIDLIYAPHLTNLHSLWQDPTIDGKVPAILLAP